MPRKEQSIPKDSVVWDSVRLPGGWCAAGWTMLSQHRCSSHWAGPLGFGGLILSFDLGVYGLCCSLFELGASQDQLHRCSAASLLAVAPVPVPGRETLMVLLGEGARNQQRVVTSCRYLMGS